MRIAVAVALSLLLASAASAIEVSSDATKISATTVSYGGASFTLWQGYFTITVTNGGAAVAGLDVRGTALGEQVTSVEATNSTGKAVLPVVTDTQPSLIHVQVRSSPSAPWEEPGPPPIVEPAPAPPAPAAAAGGGGGGGGGAGPAPALPAATVPPAAVLAPRSASGLAPGGLFNVLPGRLDWNPPAPVPEAATAPEAAAAGPSLAQAVLLDALMVGGAVGYAMFARTRPGRLP